jgi:hypothetical protein
VKATWTYQVPPAGADATGLEDYVVETRDGEAAGKVIALLDRDGERYVLFDTGNPLSRAGEQRFRGGMSRASTTTR